MTCSLDRTAYAERIGSISGLNSQGLRAHARHGRVLLLTYAPAMSARVRQLVAQESECCSALTFTIDESGMEILLEICVPDALDVALDTVFAPFLAGASATPDLASGQLRDGAWPAVPVRPVQLRSILTCPECGHAEELTMPTGACQFFHQCSRCQLLLRPESGHCCVFCSFGSVPCPPMQGDTNDNAHPLCRSVTTTAPQAHA